MLDVRKLRYFATVAELRSFTRAAAALRVAQSAVSRQVQGLEQEVGLSLFLRLGRQVRLTDAGEAMLKHAHALTRDLERLVEDMQARRGTPMGRVVLGIPPTLADTLAPLVAEQIRRGHPSISLSIVDGLTPVLADWVQNNQVDLAVLSFASIASGDDLPGLRVEPLTIEDMVVVEKSSGRPAPRSYGLRELRSKAFVLSKMLSAIVRHQLNRPRLEFTVVMEIDAVQAIKSMVLKGQAASILPMAMLSDDVRQGRLAASAITGRGIRRQLVLAQPGLRPTTQAADVVTQVLKDVVTEMSRKGAFSLHRLRESESSAHSRIR